jgi:hypothetical protein
MDDSKDKKSGERKVFDIRRRAFDFAVKIIKFCQRLEQKGGSLEPLATNC